MEKIDAIILCGGEGKRLRSIINETPKPLAIVGGKPFLDILLEQLIGFNCVNSVVLAVGYKAEKIIERYKDCSRYDFNISFSVEEELLGTGGAIKGAIKHTKTKDILVVNGDSYTEINIKDLIVTHRDNKAKITIALLKVDDASRYGSVRVNGQNKILSFDEKKKDTAPGLINAGIYIMQKKIFSDIKENKVISFEKELLPIFIRNLKGRIYGYIVKGKFIDIGIPESYKVANEYLK